LTLMAFLLLFAVLGRMNELLEKRLLFKPICGSPDRCPKREYTADTVEKAFFGLC